MSRIVDVIVTPRALELTSPFGIATGSLQRADNVFLTVVLDDGVRGTGEAAPFTAVNGETSAQVTRELEALKPWCLAQKIEDAAAISAGARGELCGSARAALDMALLDAWCRRARVSFTSFFGAQHSPVHTDFTVTTADDTAAEQAASLVRRGYITLKIKVGDRNKDHDKLSAIAQAAPGVAVLLDGNAALNSQDEALALLRHCSQLGLRVIGFEQPFGKHAWVEHATLQASLEVPVILDESISSLRDVVKTHALKAARGVNLKMQKTGVFETLQMVDVAKALGLKLMMGAMVESSLGIASAAALVSGRGGFTFVDLDTNHWLRADPTVHAHDFSKPDLLLDRRCHGHGVTLDAPE